MPGGYWPTWAATLVFFFAFYALLVPLPLHLAGAGLAGWQVGFVLGAFSVASLVLRPVAGALADGWGRPCPTPGSCCS
jgi:MFS family permease